MSAVNRSGRYSINAPDVVAEDFDGEMVILNLGNGHYFSLRGIASQIWSLLIAGREPQSILTSIQTRRPELVDASSEFLGRVIELSLVRPRADGADGPIGPIDETWSGDSPRIEVFEDLAELIYGDPIHEFDEQTGWPHPRQPR